MANPKDPKEIESLSKELMSFDLNDVGVEELERRLELAVAQLLPGDLDFFCPSNCGAVCGTKCGTLCGTDCGTFGPPLSP